MKSHGFWVVLAAGLLSGCAYFNGGVAPVSPPLAAAPVAPAKPAEATAASLVGSVWTAFAIEGVPEVVHPKPTLRWTSANEVSGTGGCNGFTGRTTSLLNSLQIGPLAPAGPACVTLPGAQEDKYFRALEQTRQARLESDQLVFRNAEGQVVLRFLQPER
ncbi:MAG: META domain-containing protein [Rhodoferax sp.]|nr:META domain-containing protein [Rhodoferax sp.]MCF8208653.1 META domain-containing protein [Rhodoferax sp.]